MKAKQNKSWYEPPYIRNIDIGLIAYHRIT